ncbi:TetR/AcrR family transcriptional regulator [Actinotalea sp. C106]|uniref:TetR/AcrR family transcriptional regulator n=1 Tax=Actinotalea sp. C106 TaxID=2908644 RepID=UPI002028BC4A|nr:TetR/AcrR family transcriptional regulator [Actinotalea sp. C106]
MTTTTPLRERQREQTRALIARTAVDLAIERGYPNVTVEEIAAAAGVAPRTFFNHFATKRDALLSWTTRLEPAAVEAFLSPEAPGLAASLQELLLAYVASADRDELGRMQELLDTNPELRPQVRDLFREFEASLADAIGRRPEVDAGSPEPRVLAALSTAVFRASFSEWTGAQGSTTLAECVASSFAIVRRALGRTDPSHQDTEQEGDEA